MSCLFCRWVGRISYATLFDNCTLSNMKLYLNSEFYPYNDMNLDFDKNRWAVLYEMYARFGREYYGFKYALPNLTIVNFLHCDFFVIAESHYCEFSTLWLVRNHCSHQNHKDFHCGRENGI